MGLRDSLDYLVAGLATARGHQAAQVDLSSEVADNLGRAADAAGRLAGGGAAIRGVDFSGGLKTRQVGADQAPPAAGPTGLFGGSPAAQGAAAANLPPVGVPGTIWIDPATGIGYLLDPAGRPYNYPNAGPLGIAPGGAAPTAPSAGSTQAATPSTPTPSAGGLPALGPVGSIWTDPVGGKSYQLDANGRPIGFDPTGAFGVSHGGASGGGGGASAAPGLGPPGTIWTDPEDGKSYELDANGRPIGYVKHGLFGITPGGASPGPGPTSAPPPRLAPFDYGPPHVVAGQPGIGAQSQPEKAADTSKPVVDGLEKLGHQIVAALKANADQGGFSRRGLG